jgi:hypothetical protein
MLNRCVNKRWLVVPLTAFLLISTGGAAVASDCHVESAAPTKSSSAAPHSHSAAPHSHSHQLDSSAVSNTQVTLVASGSALNNEICFIVGFIVLLLLRYVHLPRSIFRVGRILWPRYLQPFILTKNLGYLNLTHLQLGIIRI